MPGRQAHARQRHAGKVMKISSQREGAGATVDVNSSGIADDGRGAGELGRVVIVEHGFDIRQGGFRHAAHDLARIVALGHFLQPARAIAEAFGPAAQGLSKRFSERLIGRVVQGFGEA